MSQIEVFPNNIAVQVQPPCDATGCGVTVGEFKAALSRLAGDNEVLASIEYGCARESTGWLTIQRTESGVEIREVRQ